MTDAEVGDIEKFTKPAKILAFAGLDPSTYQSGKLNASHTPMFKRGSTYLRWTILTASRTVFMRDYTFAQYLAKKQSEGKYFYVAMIHVAKKLIRVIFYILKINTIFVPQM
ncbi:transposase [Clostridium botulinum]|uniref:transposase n=1 Tax=Clostridium botulinum TaxID=1491 RepID=UPI003C2D9F8B